MDDHGNHFLPPGKSLNKDLSFKSTAGKTRASRSRPVDKRTKTDSGATTRLHDFFQIPLEELLRSTNMGVLLTDEQDNLMWVNDVILTQADIISDTNFIVGRSAVEVIHYLQEFVVHPRLFRQRIKELIEGRKLYYGEEFPLIDGRVIGVDYIPMFRGDRYCGAIWQLIDCTKRVEHLRSQQFQPGYSFLEMLDKFHIIYCEINMQGEMMNASPFFCKFTGYPEEALLKRNIIDLCLSGKQQLLNCMKSQRPGMVAKNAFSFELEIVLRDGLKKWMQCHASFKQDNQGNPSGGMLLLTEITEQKSIQQELEDAKRIAERAQIAQQQFLANMSHDIRTPLNAIIGMTFLLEDTPVNQEQHEYIKVLKNASNILLGLLNGVLDFAKIASGKQEIRQREFDLPGLLQSLVETFSFKLNDKPVKLHYTIDPKINQILLGDDILLNQILMNLLSNAEKFTAKGEINLVVKIVKEYENNTWVEFRVEDTGIGISKEKLMEIFQDFTQADDDIRINYGGSGLGLFICKKLVEMLGGQISVESVPGRGTTFIFSLPFVMTAQPLKKQINLTSSKFAFNSNNVRILVVEDNPMNLKYLSSLLNKYQLSFDVATDGKKALKKAQDQYYNLILMDMKLPKMSGMDVAAYIREKETFNTATPIVLVSAAAFQSTVDKAREVGVNELLAKPYTPDQLVDILRKYLVEEDEEETPAFLPEDIDTFKFDERLDTAYLQKLYSGNCTYAMSLFEVFLECMEKDWNDILEAKKDEQWVQLKNLIHKVKPNFSMVGLTWITSMMQEIYEQLKQEDPLAALPLLEEVQKEFDQYLPLVSMEYQRMLLFLGQEVD